MLRVGNGRSPFGPQSICPRSAVSPFSCAYPLTNSGISGYGYQAPVMSNHDQTITKAVAAGTNTYGAASLTQATAVNAGSVLTRLKLDSLPAVAELDAVEAALAFYTGALGFIAGVTIGSATGGYSYQIKQVGGSVAATGTLASCPAFVDMQFRSAEGKVDFLLPDGTVLFTTNYDPAVLHPTVYPLLSITGTSITGADVGLTVSCSFVTNNTDLTNSPLAGSGAIDCCGNVIADPYWANVVSLMHFDGPVGAPGLTDEKGVTWTANGTTPSLTDAQKKFGPTSLLMGSDTYLSATPAVALGTGDFVLEGWFYEQGDRAFIQIGNYLLYHSSGSYYLWNGSSNLLSLAGSNLNSWVYMALVRVGGSIHFHANSLVSSSVGDSTNFGTPELRLGWFNSGNPSPIYIDEFRATYGTDRVIIAPPGGEFPNG